MRHQNKLLGLIVFLVVFPAGRALSQSTKQVVFDQSIVATATVKDSALIDFFLQAYLIPETDVEMMRFYDVTGNGFGEEDLIKCFPSEMTYFPAPSDTAEKTIKSWKFLSNKQVVTENVAPEVFEGRTTDKATNWIIAGLLRSLNWNYKDFPIKIYFERDSSTMEFEMWGFNEKAMQWRPPPPPPKIAETTYDVIHILRSDTLFIADTTYYDQFFVFRSVQDTVYIPERELEKVHTQHAPEYLPGLSRKK